MAFLRGGVDARPQLAIVSAEGGEPRIVTDAPLGVDEFVWSRDSRKLAFVARMPEEGRYGTLEGVPAEREDPRLIVGNKYQANGIGYIRDRPRGTLPPGGSLPRRGTLAGTPGACGNGNRGGTQGQHDARGEAWHPPGEAAHPAGGRLPPAGVHTRRETGMLHRCPARRGGLGSALDDPPRARHRRGTGPRGRGGRSHVGMVAAPVQP